MSAYEALAASYDSLTYDVDYEKILQFYERLFRRYRLRPETVLDLACGTGSLSLLLAGRIENDARTHFAVMDITAVRNAYGRQLGSFHTEADFAGVGAIPMTFIRAPYIASFSGAVQALAEVDGKVVAARERGLLVTAFHPELDGDPTVHTYFLDMIRTIK